MDEGADLLSGCPYCGWKKFQFVRSRKSSAGKGRGWTRGEAVGSADYPEVGEGTVISRAMGVREPPMNTTSRSRPLETISLGNDSPEAKKEEEQKPAEFQGKDMSEDDGSVESIRISEPGSYELNLPSLFQRDELVMAVKDGTYMIDLHTAFRRPKKD
ncbi:MAG: hypothetical protein GKC10_07835 [Methanosarcinales archaeon]|nr:hypothetical protein [Methanosarcinales archaeon]